MFQFCSVPNRINQLVISKSKLSHTLGLERVRVSRLNWLVFKKIKSGYSRYVALIILYAYEKCKKLQVLNR